MGQYARSLKEMQEAKTESDRQLANFREQNTYLKEALEKKAEQAKDIHVLQAAFEDEHNKRRVTEREIEQLKTEI